MTQRERVQQSHSNVMVLPSHSNNQTELFQKCSSLDVRIVHETGRLEDSLGRLWEFVPAIAPETPRSVHGEVFQECDQNVRETSGRLKDANSRRSIVQAAADQAIHVTAARDDLSRFEKAP
jgi:hypothetical protein